MERFFFFKQDFLVSWIETFLISQRRDYYVSLGLGVVLLGIRGFCLVYGPFNVFTILNGSNILYSIYRFLWISLRYLSMRLLVMDFLGGD